MISKLATCVGVASIIATAMAANPASAQEIEWNSDGAIAVGSACSSVGPFADTFFISAGSDVSVIFTNFGVDLTSEEDGTTAVHSCLVRVPITVPAHVALAELTQQLHWGYSKDRGTEAEVFARATFFHRRTTGIRRRVGRRVSGVESFLTEEVKDRYLHLNGLFCSGRSQRGLLSVNLGLSARRDNTSRSISVRMIGQDIKYEALAEWIHC